MTLKEVLMLTASDGCEQPNPTLLREDDPMEMALVEAAASYALNRINTGQCERFDFPMIEPGIDRRVLSHCERIKSGDAVIEVMVSVIEDTKREAIRGNDDDCRTGVFR